MIFIQFYAKNQQKIREKSVLLPKIVKLLYITGVYSYSF